MDTEVIIAAISAMLLAVSVFYVSRQVILLRKQHKENHDWNRRLAAQQAVRDYREIQSMMETISEHFDYQERTEGIPFYDFEKSLARLLACSLVYIQL